jgi:3'(2'), 5'-bisphosphate nucleotidase
MTAAPGALAERVAAIARAAGREILEVYARGALPATLKEDASPLTEADLRAHRLIVAALAALTPGVPVLSEEAARPPWSERARWTRHWLVDPLDGTREFLARNGEFTVNIALIENHAPVLGVVHVPVSDTTYRGGRLAAARHRPSAGARGRSARRRSGARGRQPLPSRRLARGLSRAPGIA